MHLNLSAKGKMKTQQLLFHFKLFLTGSTLSRCVLQCCVYDCVSVCRALFSHQLFIWVCSTFPSQAEWIRAGACVFRSFVTQLCLEACSVGPLTAGPLCGAKPGSSLLMRHCSLLPPSHYYFFFLSSFTFLPPFVPPPLPFSPSSLISSCSLSFHNFFTVFFFVFPQLLPSFYPPLFYFLSCVPNSKL